ncbi:Pkinase-domain-containing protein [Rozella allomycis CSF55]|uniref:[RNA-polymerase]-subunit kinase n=1 Tax=Rozella allomycis (strain CSF55) TaxID=988480 RepID=A0A4P9YHH6_ROZAC|nr:Pkinase-domain-containing protein [Rozella allomycis CSF55]
MEKYEKICKIGEGTYAVVYKGRIKKTNETIAIKKIKVSNFTIGIDHSALREIKFLQELKHPNIIKLFDVFSHKKNLNMVLEFLDADLEHLIKDTNVVFMPADIKSWMWMLFNGLSYCHMHFVVHRDLKPNNLLLSQNGVLKIADFGLAREYGSPNDRMTHVAVTRWYRPPELLFGARLYSSAVDLWSCGCIFAELMLRTPFIAGENDIDQIKKIFMALGTPTEQDWPGMKSLPNFMTFDENFLRRPLSNLFSAAGKDSIDLLEQMMRYDPAKRISSVQALKHPYFENEPLPTHPELLPKLVRKNQLENTAMDVDEVGMKPIKLF